MQALNKGSDSDIMKPLADIYKAHLCVIGSYIKDLS